MPDDYSGFTPVKTDDYSGFVPVRATPKDTPPPKSAVATKPRAEMRRATPSETVKFREAEKRDAAKPRPLSYDPSDPLGYAYALAEREGGVKGFVRGNLAGSVEPGNILLGALTGGAAPAVRAIATAKAAKSGASAFGALRKGAQAEKTAKRAIGAVGGGVGAGVFGQQSYQGFSEGDIGKGLAAGAAGAASVLLGRKALAGRKKGEQGAVQEREAAQVLQRKSQEAGAAGGQRGRVQPVQQGPRPTGTVQQGKPQTVTKAPAAPAATVAIQAGKARTRKAKGTQQTAPLSGQEDVVPVGTTGIANQVQEREALAGVISKVDPAQGKNAQHWQEVGEKVVTEATDPESDFEVLARRVARGEVDPSPKRFGILQAGKTRLMRDLNAAQKALDAAPADKDALAVYDKARDRLDTYVNDVQAGKGVWSDMGRALQAGTELDTGNFAEVLLERNRRGSKVPDKKLQEMVGQVTERDERIRNLEQELTDVKADRAMQRLSRERRTATKIEDIKARREAAIRKLRKTTGQLQAGIDPEQARAFYNYARTWAEEGVTRLDDLAQKAVEELGWKREDVVAHLAAKMSTMRTQSEITKQIRALRSEAGAEAKIADLKRQLETREFAAPDIKTKAVEARIENLRAERNFWSNMVRRATRPQEPLGKQIVKDAASLIRGTVLGSDLGVIMRQGLFGTPKTKVKSAVQAGKSMLSDSAIAKYEMKTMGEHAKDGRLYSAVERSSGLSLSDHISAPEELALGRVLRHLPIIGKPLDRFQHVYINEARRTMFRRAVDDGFNEVELKEWARYINTVTGRGNVKDVPAWAEMLLTSPRYEKSRWEAVGELVKSPVTAARAVNNKAARAKMTNLATTAGQVYVIYKGAELAGYDVDWNPTSSDFLKMRRGNEVWDVSAGMAPRIRDIMRVVMFSEDPDYRENLKRVAGDIALRPVSPAVRTPVEQGSLALQNRSGVSKPKSPFSGFPPGELEQGWWAWSPLVVKAFWQGTKEEGIGTGVSALGKEFVGTGVSRYPKRSENQKPKRTRIMSGRE